MPDHKTLIRIRGYHADAYGHVHHARYLELLEEARWRLLEERMDLGALARAALGFAVVNVDIDFRRPARAGECLEIRSRLTRLGEKSGLLNQKIVTENESALVVDADVTFVLIDVRSGSPVPFTDELREAFGPPQEGEVKP